MKNLGTITNDKDLVNKGYVDTTFAAKDGDYSADGLISAKAKNLVSELVPQAASNVVFRPTASQFSGQSWQRNSISGQTATIEKIKGKTLVWNQLANVTKTTDTSHGITFTKNTNGSITIVGTNDGTRSELSICDLTMISGHKYLMLFNGIDVINDSDYFGFVYGSNVLVGAILKGGLIATAIGSGKATMLFYVNAGKSINLTVFLQVHDLTHMFGAGNEPNTVGEFRAMHPLNYPYNAGELISFNGTGLKTVGFNQWDEEWEIGSINSSGNNYPSTTNIRSKNYIPIFPSTTYYLRTASKNMTVFFYDVNQKLIDYFARNNTSINSPSDACYCRFYMADAYGTTYNHDICINLSWSGVRDGEYEPYWDSELSLPIVTYFPDGMKSEGTVYDELTKDKAVKRFIKITTENAILHATSSAGYNTYKIILLTSCKPGGKVVSNYTRGVHSFDSSTVSDEAIQPVFDGILYFAVRPTRNIGDIVFYVELAEPVETPINPPLNLTYRVDDSGTEMLLPQNDDEPTTAPMDAEITYGIDYEGNVRNLPANYANNNFINAVISALKGIGITMTATNDFGTWKVTMARDEAQNE